MIFSRENWKKDTEWESWFLFGTFRDWHTTTNSVERIVPQPGESLAFTSCYSRGSLNLVDWFRSRSNHDNQVRLAMTSFLIVINNNKERKSDVEEDY